jgi:hypothetical protein
MGAAIKSTMTSPQHIFLVFINFPPPVLPCRVHCRASAQDIQLASPFLTKLVLSHFAPNTARCFLTLVN